ncbi:MAG: PTS sugar transporter subunit IIA, partial [Roseicyclus sp.]|nr:PTS sugar transporter subunit IIA [Roseicyclus sp.]
MDLPTLLKPQGVKVVSDVTSKKRLMQTIADVAQNLVGLPASSIFDALQDRESLGPTGVGHGVALPHARLGDLTNVSGAFLKLDKPIDFESVDRQPV